MNDQLSKEIFSRLDQIGAKIGELGSLGFQMLVQKERYVDGWAALGFTLFLAFIALLLLLKIAPGFYRKYAGATPNSPRERNFGIATAVTFVAGGFIAMCALSNLYDPIAHILAPQYYALTDILKMMKG